MIMIAIYAVTVISRFNFFGSGRDGGWGERVCVHVRQREGQRGGGGGLCVYSF